MMAKRKLGRRKPSGGLVQKPRRSAIDRGTIEHQIRRARATGGAAVIDPRTGDIAEGQRGREGTAHDVPLEVLYANGKVTADQAEAGRRFARVYWQTFGKPFARTGKLDQPTGRDPSAGSRMRAKADAMALLDALAREGADVLRWTRAYVVEERWDWLLEEPARSPDGGGRYYEARLALLRRGLSAIARTASRRIDADDVERAEREEVS